MSFKTWTEYLNGKGKLITDPKTEDVPDYNGPTPASPGKTDKDKNAGGAKKGAGSAAPYKAGKDKKPKDIGPGFADKKGTVTTPMPKQTNLKLKTAPGTYGGVAPQAKHPYPSDPKKPFKMKMGKTEAFLDKTKNMNMSEFVQHMYYECACDAHEDDDSLPHVTAYAAGKFHPHPPEAIEYVAALAKKNPRIMDMLVHAIKDKDALPDMLSVTMDHPETYDHLTDLFGDEEDGPSRASALARSMDGAVSKFKGDMFEAVTTPYGFSNDGVHDHDSMNSEDPNDEDQEAGPGDVQDNDAISDDDDGMNKDDSDSPPPDDDDKSPEDEEQGMSDDDKDSDKDSDDHDDHEEPQEKPKKLKKKFAHHHLLGAMSAHPSLHDDMKNYQ